MKTCFALLALALIGLLPAQEVVFRSEARLVEVYATVLDDRGKYMDGLVRERFIVSEDGKPQDVVAARLDLFPQVLQGRLALVDLGHAALHAGEALLDLRDDFGMELELAIEREGDGFARDVVLGGPEAARENHDGRAAERGAHGTGQAFAIVADHRFGSDLHAEVVELGREVERIGIDALGGEQFGADGDDLGVH